MSDGLGMIKEDGTCKSLAQDTAETLETVLKPQPEPS